MNSQNLSELPLGIEATLVGFESRLDPQVEATLLSMGFIPGTTVVVEKKAPFGGAFAIRIRGGLLALRKSLARMILVSQTASEKVNHGP